MKTKIPKLDVEIARKHLTEYARREFDVSASLRRVLALPGMNKDNAAGIKQDMQDLLDAVSKLDNCIRKVNMPPAEMALTASFASIVITTLSLRRELYDMMTKLVQTAENDSDLAEVMTVYRDVVTKLVSAAVGKLADAVKLEDKDWTDSVRAQGQLARTRWHEYLRDANGDVALAALEMANTMLKARAKELEEEDSDKKPESSTDWGVISDEVDAQRFKE